MHSPLDQGAYGEHCGERSGARPCGPPLAHSGPGAQVLRTGKKIGPWTKEEDRIIIECINAGVTKWSEIAARVPGRIGKQCRERWFNHLDPSIKKTPWTDEEDRLLAEAQRVHGARQAGGRPQLRTSSRATPPRGEQGIGGARSPACFPDARRTRSRTDGTAPNASSEALAHAAAAAAATVVAGEVGGGSVGTEALQPPPSPRRPLLPLLPPPPPLLRVGATGVLPKPPAARLHGGLGVRCARREATTTTRARRRTRRMR